jgi:hypothetical protein
MQLVYGRVCSECRGSLLTVKGEVTCMLPSCRNYNQPMWDEWEAAHKYADLIRRANSAGFRMAADGGTRLLREEDAAALIYLVQATP